MGTTSLYVELVIVGLETITWISSFSIFLTDIKYISVIKGLIEKLPSSIFLLGIMYILGLIFDRISDWLFKKKEKQIRNNSGLEARSSILIWKASMQEEYFTFTRSKIRILRASTINIPLIVASIALNVLKYYPSKYIFLGFILIVGGVFSYFTLVSYNHSIISFYNKAKILEELKKTEVPQNSHH